MGLEFLSPQLTSRHGIFYALNTHLVGHGFRLAVHLGRVVLVGFVRGVCLSTLAFDGAKASSAHDVATNASDAQRHARERKTLGR